MNLLPVWMRRLLMALSIGLVAGLVCFAWVAWLSPTARIGQRNQRNSYRVRTGMSQRQALAIMGPAQEVKIHPSDKQHMLYTYAAHPFASDAIYLDVGPDSLVTGINHGE